MRTRHPRRFAWPAAALAMALLAAGCSGANKATDSHPETFEAAKALAAKRGTPLLVDFYSPT